MFKVFFFLSYSRLSGGYSDLPEEDVLHGGDDVHLTQHAVVVVVVALSTKPNPNHHATLQLLVQNKDFYVPRLF